MWFSWRSGRFRKPRNCMGEIIVEVQKSLNDIQGIKGKSFKQSASVAWRYEE